MSPNLRQFYTDVLAPGVLAIDQMIPLLVFAVVAIFLIARLIARGNRGPRYPIQRTGPWPGASRVVGTEDAEASKGQELTPDNPWKPLKC